MKPRRNQNELVEIDIAMTIQTVLKVDERFQYISFYGWFEVQWRDEFLMWNETVYQGIKKISVPYQHVWVPDISMYYSEEHIHDLGVHPFVSVTSQGHVTWFPGAKYTVQCYLKVKNEVKGIAENGEWEFQNFTYEENYDAEFDLTKIVYTLEFQRRYRYFLLCTIMPIVILSVLNSLTFLIPVESGERITYCLTLFLTFTVFLTLFDQTMPRNSIDVPYITVFVSFHLFLCVISTMVSILTISSKRGQECDSRDTQIVPLESQGEDLHLGEVNADGKRSGSSGKNYLRRTLKSILKEVFICKIDTVMLVMNFFFLGSSAFVLVICYIS